MWHVLKRFDLSDWHDRALLVAVALLGGFLAAYLYTMWQYRRRSRAKLAAVRDSLCVQAMMDWLPPPPDAQGRRKSVRRDGNVIEVKVTDRRKVTKPCKGFVLDRSTGGLRLAVGEDHPPGTYLNVKVADKAARAPWTLVEVRNCRKSGNFYEVGCQFVETPPWGVLLLFG